jgi:uncharacterized repeat protein (TIGR03803 family)
MRQGNRTSIGLKTGLALLAMALVMTGTLAFAQQETVLHRFGSGKDGNTPFGGLVFDATGNLYGTTSAGGAYGGGIVFELSPTSGGDWKEEILYNFGSGTDAQNPEAGLIFDPAGNLFGTTLEGGAYGAGTVFELSPKPGGGWREKVLHSFQYNGQDGFFPLATVTLDSSGNLYGTTTSGGTYDGGVVFELLNNGSWFENILHNFNPPAGDGQSPQAGVTFGSSGYLYGTTAQGGTHDNWGTVFELGRKPGGGWGEKVLLDFDGTDGSEPSASLIFDAAGNLYGTTSLGGTTADNAEVFEMSPAAGGGLVFDTAGNLYGATSELYQGGELFELVAGAGGSWTYNLLCNLGGTYPVGTLIFDTSGNLYGETRGDGTPENDGTVFEVTP